MRFYAGAAGEGELTADATRIKTEEMVFVRQSFAYLNVVHAAT